MRFLPAALLAAMPVAVEAGFRVCNDTGAAVRVALGYQGAGGWTSEGWWTVDSDSCKRLKGGDLSGRYWYWAARSDSLDFGRGEFSFCTGTSPFTIVGDTDCTARGFEDTRFFQSDTGGAARHTLVLRDDMAVGTAAPPRPAPSPAPQRATGITDATAAAPGTHGEPFSIAGRLSHCQVNDASRECEIHANGWRYVANSADPTAPAILDWLESLGENTPVGVAGDMISYGGTVARITLREAELGPADPHAAIRADLQGLWISRDDSNYRLLIHGGVAEELYDANSTGSSMLDVSATCDAMPDVTPDSGTWIVFHPFDPEDEIRCMDLMELSDRELMLFPWGVMKPLHFDRSN